VKRPLRRAISVCLLLAGACVSHSIDADVEAIVRRVYDGDTIEVEFRGVTERVRYIGIDTPEMGDPRPPIREVARAAAAENRALVDGRVVRLEFDVQQRDRYGRLLAYVWVGDPRINERLVRDGFARAGSYPPNVRLQDRLRAAERSARTDGRRLWDGRLGDEPLRVPDRAAPRSAGS
jgi:micrococcal nuclease